MSYILAIDQGTTSSRAIVFDAQTKPCKTVQQEFTQHFPQSGWVEHDPEEIWRSVIAVAEEARKGYDIAALGITNQRETVIIWDKDTGKPIHNAIVWQDRRTAAECGELKAAGYEKMITQTTGLVLDPYFSASKIAWLLNHVEGAQKRAEAGELLFGTVDSFLIWRLTQGQVHATDATNAARTMLYDIHQGAWSSEICSLFNIPMQMLPEVKDCADNFGVASRLGDIPIYGVAGDQQAATIGQACFEPGMLKSTYGTGCFALLNTGETPVNSTNRLLTTIAYRLDGKVTYALEGSVYIAGAVVQWMRDVLGIVASADQTHAMAEQADDSQNVIIVPAFTGLGAPYWHSECRGGIFGLTRNSGPNEFARAALESIGYQTLDLLEAMRADLPEIKTNILRVDGGMSASNYTMQFLADVCNVQVDRPVVLETTALGVAWLAGMKAGIYPNKEDFAANWMRENSFEPQNINASNYKLWKKAVNATMMV